MVAAAGVALFFVYYESPMRAELAVRQTQLEGLRADLDKGHATARRLPEFRAQVAELESRLENLNAVLPSEKDAADLLRRLQTVAVQSNLDIRSFHLNFELGVLLYGLDVVKQVRAAQQAYIDQSTPICAQEWAKRSIVRKYLERAVSLLSPLL